MATEERTNSSAEERSWKLADLYVNFYGDFSSLFTSTISSIIRSYGDRENVEGLKLSGSAWQSAYFLINTSPTLKVVFYRAAETYYPEELAGLKEVKLANVLELFSPSEVSSILTLTYLYRRTRKLVKAEEWKIVVPIFHQHGRIGGVIGSTLRDVGVGNGTLITGVRVLAISLLSKENLKSFQEYRRDCAKNEILFELAKEEKLFGCNHMQIASRLFSKMGFSHPYSPISFCFGLLSSQPTIEDLEDDVRNRILSWKIILDWTNDLHFTGELVNTFEEDHDLYMSSDQEDALATQVFEVLEMEVPLGWLDTTEKDVDAKVLNALSRQRKINPESTEAELE